jgi:hypothetical protein
MQSGQPRDVLHAGAVFYSGYFVSAGWILFIVSSNHSSGRSWRESAPQGYGLGVIGLGIFAVGAAGDMIWHTIFGVESGLDTLFSPTHLLLLTGALLAALSPFRAAWSSPDNVLRLAPLLSIVFFTAAIAFFFGFASPFNRNWTAFDSAVFTARLEAAGVQDARLIFTSMENVQLRGIAGALFAKPHPPRPSAAPRAPMAGAVRLVHPAFRDDRSAQRRHRQPLVVGACRGRRACGSHRRLPHSR